MGTSTVLQIVQTFADKMGLPYPLALVGATDKTNRQYRALMREAIQDLSEYRWQEQTVQGSFTSVASQDQGELPTLFPGYLTLKQNTLWDNTRHMRIFGPLSDAIWEALQTLPNAGPEYQCYVQGNHLFVSPALPAGDNIIGIYTSRYVVITDTTGVLKEFVTADNDRLVFPDNVVQRCFEYKWRKQKGEAGWEDDYNDFMGLLAKNIANAGSTTVSLDATPYRGPQPGIVIPPGSWPV